MANSDNMEMQYLNMLRDIADNGRWQENRTGINTKGLFGYQLRFDLSEGRFPLLTTKKVHWPAIVHELLWFIRGETNAGALIENNVRIWNEWTPAYKEGGQLLVEEAFRENPRHQSLELGPVYGAQWRNFGQSDAEQNPGVDQLKDVIERIKTTPQCRRLIVSAWNPKDIPDMALPPCHCFFQFRVMEGRLHMQMYQRSADVFLGVPFNIASYALLLRLVAFECKLQPGTFVHTFGDVHIYQNHWEQVQEQLSRTPGKLPALAFKEPPESIFDFKYENIELVGYEPQAFIKAKVAV